MFKKYYSADNNNPLMRKKYIILNFSVIVIVFNFCSDSHTAAEKESTIVDYFGQLKMEGKQIVDQNDNVIVLRGMSLFWSQWGGRYYNKETIKWLRDDWKCTIIRAAIGVENGGYLENNLTELTRAYTVIDACIDLGIYVIVDWHDHRAEAHQDEAIEFFSAISHKYGNKPNVLYEIYNEPLDVSWQNVLVPYTDTLVAEIRKNDPDNIIIVGTPNWSQDVEDVIGHKIAEDNISYTLHFYTSTHGQWLRDKANQAISADIPIFVTEWGLSESNGTGEIDLQESNIWISFLELNNLSWCNWSIINKDESSAALLPFTSALSGWNEDELTQSGKMIRNYLIEMNSELFDLIEE
jgi:endoglucanase